MSLLSKRTAQQPKPTEQESSTFFAAASPKPEDEKTEKTAEPAPDQQKATTQEPANKPARTFFDAGGAHRDPLYELSTNRAGRPVMSDDEREARKAAEEQRARRGLENLQAMMHR